MIDCNICDVFHSVFYYALLITISIVMLLVMYLGFLLLFAGGNPARLQRAKELLLTLGVGTILIAGFSLAFFIIYGKQLRPPYDVRWAAWLALGVFVSLLFIPILLKQFKANKANKRRSFAATVATRVVSKKVRTCGVLLIAATGGAFFGLSNWFTVLMTAAAMWYGLDAAVVSYRISTGRYGDTDVEVLEAARYVINHLDGGHGRGHFDTVFEPLSQQPMPKTPEGLGEAARI